MKYVTKINALLLNVPSPDGLEFMKYAESIRNWAQSRGAQELLIEYKDGYILIWTDNENFAKELAEVNTELLKFQISYEIINDDHK